jgi:hypothetical protein
MIFHRTRGREDGSPGGLAVYSPANEPVLNEQGVRTAINAIQLALWAGSGPEVAFATYAPPCFVESGDLVSGGLRGGFLLSPDSWEDQRVVDAVKATGRKKLITAGLYTEICVAFPALQAAGEGYDVYVVTDASGGVTAEAHDMAVRRMVQAGITPITWLAVLAELQRDWARTDLVAPEDLAALMGYSGGSGVAFAWEMQLLHTPGT